MAPWFETAQGRLLTMRGGIARPVGTDPGVPSGLRRLRARPNLLKRINVIPPVQSHLQKYFCFRLTQISSLSRAVLTHRGALRNVINAGQDAVDADSA